MKKKLRGLFRIIFGRTAFVMAGLGLQLWVFIAAFKFLNGYLHYFYILCVLLSALAVIAILNEPIDSSFKMAWIIPVLVIPVFGVLLYIFVQMQFQTKALARRLTASTAKTRPYLNQNEDVRKELEALDAVRPDWRITWNVWLERRYIKIRTSSIFPWERICSYG